MGSVNDTIMDDTTCRFCLQNSHDDDHKPMYITCQCTQPICRDCFELDIYKYK